MGGTKNTVTLDFAGDTTKLDKAFNNVGVSAGKMSAKVDDAGRGLDHFSGKTDEAATKASTTYGAIGALGSGLSLMGLEGSAAGTALAGVGLGFDALSGVTDIATLALESNTVKTIANKAATLGSAAASKAAAAGQWLLNAALSANPIGLIVIAIAGLVAAVVLIATKTDWFQRGWRAAWGGIRGAAVAVWDWLRTLPDKIGGIGSAIFGAITWPYRTAFNLIADAWNNTVGQLHISIPSWVPFFGGKGFDFPRLPHFHTGGVVPGAPGSEMLAVLQAGERVTPAGGSSSRTVYVAAGDAVTEAVFARIRDMVATQFGGDVEIALAGSR